MNWLAPEDMRALGLALLHFLWQGAALAALLAMLLAICRRASVRYTLGVLTLALMMAAPVVTFVAVRRAAVPAASPAVEAKAIVSPATPASAVAANSTSQPSPTPLDVWLIEAWFAGVALFSIRAGGGFLLVARLRRRDATPLSAALQQMCRALQRRMGIARAVQYCESRLLQVPAVLGWVRPVVLLPVAALTGLSPQQLEMVIAHELAHVRRLDAVMNIFQVAVETLLFYHPAVWWVSRRIRAERENCCDDVAVALTGGRVEYARALTLIEEWRGTPRFAMAVSGSPLARRVMRLLGLENAGRGMRTACTLMGLLCLAIALGAGDALLGARSYGAADAPNIAFQSAEERPPLRQAQLQVRPGGPRAGVVGGVKEGVSGGVRGGVEGGLTSGLAGGVKGGVPGGVVGGVDGSDHQQQTESSSGSYIDGLRSAGLTSFTVDQLIAMKIHGVTPEFVRALRPMGLQPGPEELVAFRIHQVTPEFVRNVQATGLRPTADELVAMRIHEVTPQYVRALQAVGPHNAAPDFFISAKVMGISQQTAEKARSRGFQNLDVEKLRALQDANTI